MDKRLKILITGCNGYIGSHLNQKLQNVPFYSIFGTDISTPEITPDYRFIQTDLTDLPSSDHLVENFQPHVIIHLAASLDRSRAIESANDIFRINVESTINLLAAASKYKSEKIIFSSTSDVYGDIESPFDENDNVKPMSLYGISKHSSELLLDYFNRMLGKTVIILRFFNIYGKGMRSRLFITEIMNAIRAGNDFSMTKGEQIRDYVHIKDVIRSIIFAIEMKNDHQSHVINICSGEGISMSDLADKINNASGKRIKINKGSLPYRKNEIWKMVGSNHKAKEVLGFVPEVSLEHGIKMLFDE